jgi:hypothetical protein
MTTQKPYFKSVWERAHSHLDTRCKGKALRCSFLARFQPDQKYGLSSLRENEHCIRPRVSREFLTRKIKAAFVSISFIV